MRVEVRIRIGIADGAWLRYFDIASQQPQSSHPVSRVGLDSPFLVVIAKYLARTHRVY